MIRIVSPLMALLLSLHALLGCCAHHAHADSHECDRHARQISADACGCCEHNAMVDHESIGVHSADATEAQFATLPGGDEPSEHEHGDCQGVCTFVRGKHVTLDAPDAAGLALPVVDWQTFGALNAADLVRFLSHPPGLHSGVRLHLVHQVLVI